MIESRSIQWPSERLAMLFSENTEKNDLFSEKKALQFRYGEIISKKQFEFTPDLIETYKKYTIIQPNDIMINGLNLNYDFVSQRVAHVPTNGIITSAYICLRPRGNVNSRFYTYYLKALDSRKVLNGMGTGIRLTLSYDLMKNMPLPVPPRAEQDQIVRYLDWQVSKINRLIAAKKREIGLLKEQEQIQISRIIVHGNYDDSDLVESGEQWIGSIPKTWITCRCKYLFSERNERSQEGQETHLSMSQKHGLVPDSMLDERRMLSESYAGGKICYEDDLVLNRLKAHLGVFSLAPQMGVISPDYTVLVPSKEKINPQYAEHVLKSVKCRRELRIRVRGIIEGFWRLYTEDFNTIVIPLPPLSEQVQIVEQIEQYHAALQDAIGGIDKQIEKLQELRTRLISDVVTGQIDVRDVEIPDFEYTPDNDAVDNDDDADDEDISEQEE